MADNTKPHEERLLQGSLNLTRTGTAINLQAPSDVLRAKTVVITPAGRHTIEFDRPGRGHGHFTQWNRRNNIPTLAERRMLHSWDLDTPRRVMGATCNRRHRTAREARMCSGKITPVIELSDTDEGKPLRASGPMRRPLRTRSSTPRPTRPTPRMSPKPNGFIYQLKASANNPGAVVQLHAPSSPRPNGMVEAEASLPMDRNLGNVPKKTTEQETETLAAQYRESLKVCKDIQAELKAHMMDMIKMADNSNMYLSLQMSRLNGTIDKVAQSKVALPLSMELLPKTNHFTAEASSQQITHNPPPVVIQPPPSPILETPENSSEEENNMRQLEIDIAEAMLDMSSSPDCSYIEPVDLLACETKELKLE